MIVRLQHICRYDPNINDIEFDAKRNCINLYVNNKAGAQRFVESCPLHIDTAAVKYYEKNSTVWLMDNRGVKVSNPSRYSAEHSENRNYSREYRDFIEYGTSVIAVANDDMQSMGDIDEFFKANFTRIPRWSAGCLTQDAQTGIYYLVTTIHSLEVRLGLQPGSQITTGKHDITDMTFYLRFNDSGRIKYVLLSQKGVGYFGNYFPAAHQKEIPVDVLAIRIDKPEECQTKCNFGYISGQQIHNGVASNHRSVCIRQPVFKQSRNFSTPTNGIAICNSTINVKTDFNSEQMINVENMAHLNQCSGSVMYTYHTESNVMTLYGLTHSAFSDHLDRLVVRGVCLQSCLVALKQEFELELKIVHDNSLNGV